ncbi:hypothetical protein F3Y22_tig00116939pilonHSYRG00263 [Hibiscus syriacus]|uniref:Protein kinase domain-containing protein n=1 Tax=Hibiscus syriacus TaxID=106335 RepID=A0A6A2WZB8_HIBSY|nr:hypothetical protein F3Y22_tig00116939pilonHSYRG00263 [Hibiscus syriacus]
MVRIRVKVRPASALEYLHHDCETPVVHCDIKPSNVLLDEEMSAHLTNFGLARILLKNSPNAHFSSSLGLKGSIGYMAPEYSTGAGVSTRGDVYSFGIDVVEDELKQKEWQPAYDDGIGRMLEIGFMCASKLPEERPTMTEVSVMIKIVKASLSK